MIIKGGARARGQQLAAHLLRADTNEKVRLLDLRGVAARDLPGAIAEMEAVAAGSRATKPLYHVSLSPEAHEVLTPAQWIEAADRLGEALGLDGHQRIIMFHKKDGREHVHVCWNRVDAETLKAAHHSHNYRTHEEVARALEREFGLNRTQGVHAEREGAKKPRERPKTKESQQEARTGWKKEDAKTAIREAWEQGGNGAAFRDRMEAAGYRLAQGDRRDFVIVDPAGGVHSIRSGVRGLRVAEIRDRFADLDIGALPSVAEAVRAGRESYPAYRAGEKEGRTASPLQLQLQLQPQLPPPTYRPTQPAAGRYNILRPATVRMSVEPAPAKPVPTVRPPQPTLAPPSWAREATEETRRSRPGTPAPPRASSEAAPVQSAEMRGLVARQEAEWTQTLSRLVHDHRRAVADLEAHHRQRLAALPVEIDKRLAELNGIASRTGALFNRETRDREIAYLVAKRQRSLVEEQARQEKVKDDLRRAQVKEIEQARGKHDRLSALQRGTLEKREQNPSSRPQARSNPRDYER